jgi:hypothetical protein
MDPLLLNPGTSWMTAVSLTFLLLYSKEKVQGVHFALSWAVSGGGGERVSSIQILFARPNVSQANSVRNIRVTSVSYEILYWNLILFFPHRFVTCTYFRICIPVLPTLVWLDVVSFDFVWYKYYRHACYIMCWFVMWFNTLMPYNRMLQRNPRIMSASVWEDIMKGFSTGHNSDHSYTIENQKDFADM